MLSVLSGFDALSQKKDHNVSWKINRGLQFFDPFGVGNISRETWVSRQHS